MEKLLLNQDEFDIPHKKAPLEKLEGWRKAALVLNATRRFRYTANLKRKRELCDGRRKFRVGVLAATAALLFLDERSNGYPSEPDPEAQKHGFAVDAPTLARMSENPNLFHELGGLDVVAEKLKVQLEVGIPGDEVDIEERQLVFGRNAYVEKPPRGFWVFVWESLHDLTLIVLIISALVSLAVGIPTEGIWQGWYDGVGILSSVLIVVFVTASSDYRQSLQFRDLEKERKKIDVQVIRGGHRQKVSIYDIVVGDVVHLSIGDQVPADGIYISGYSLTIDESSLTGESDPAYPSDERPFLLSGTFVQDGSGQMLVTGVGMNTEWGNLMSTISEGGDDETPLQVSLNGVATLVGKMGLLFAVLTLLVLLLRFIISKDDLKQWSGGDFIKIVNYFATAVTIVVVAVPEGLPLAVTLSLAYAMKQMMKDKALVRHLAACETMGSATCICSDKTGTLTANQMTLVKAWLGGEVRVTEQARIGFSGTAFDTLVEGIFLNTSGEIVESTNQCELHGSPTETAILRFGLSIGGKFKEVLSKAKVVKVEPFNSTKKRMAVLVKLADGKHRVHYKGASEIVLDMCNSMMNLNGQIVPLDKDELKKVIKSFAAEALRTLCLAFKEVGPCSGDSLPDEGLTCLAIVGIKDPVRPEVMSAIDLCFKAGIAVRMVTGDNIETARAIAYECNILTEDGLAVEGHDFRRWTAYEMQERIPKLQVIARSSPADKLLLVNNLKRLSEVVAVTGDGTNDAPALHEADIGLAMGISGTEVAKASADIVILDDNFSTIVKVVKWGRSVYANIQKFLQFQLTVNVVALVLNFSSACIAGRTPLTAVQLLWVNLIMDTLGALALATEPPYDELMERAPVGRAGYLINNIMWRNIFGGAIYQLVVLCVLQYHGNAFLHLEGDDAQVTLDTIIFNTFVFCQVFNELNSRELEKMNVFKHTLNNKIFIGIICFTIVFQVIIVEFLGKLARTVPLSKEHWLVSVAIGFFSLLVATLVKLFPVPSKPFFKLGVSSIFSSSKSVNHFQDSNTRPLLETVV